MQKYGQTIFSNEGSGMGVYTKFVMMMGLE
jgi:hypothetical protein